MEGQVGWWTPLTLTLLDQVDLCELMVSLLYMASQGYIVRSCLNKTKQNKQTK
jgi:hypothetical protein